MLVAVLATDISEEVRAHESIFQSADKDFSVDLFLTFVCSSHWKQLPVGQPPFDSLGESCVNDYSCLQQGCSCRDLHIWTPWPELKRVFSKAFPEISLYVLKERIMVSTCKIHAFLCANSSKKQWIERQRDKQLCSAPVKTDTACSCRRSDGSPHLMLGAVCNIPEQPEEGCWGQRVKLRREGQGLVCRKCDDLRTFYRQSISI